MTHRPLISKMVTRIPIAACSLLLTTVSITHAQAQTGGVDNLEGLLACRSITNAEARLSCFDENTALLDTAQKSGEVVVVTKEDVARAERESFGLRASDIAPIDRLVKGGVTIQEKAEPALPSKEEAKIQKTKREASAGKVTELETAEDQELREVSIPIERVDTFGYQRKRFYLTNGQVWEQTTSQSLRVPKQREGQPQNFIELQKAAVGGFFLRVNGTGRAVRARRVR